MDNKLEVPVLKVFRTGLSFYLFFSTKMRNNDIIKSDIYMFLLYNHMCCFEGQAMRFYYVYSEFVTGFDIDASKNYKIVIFSDINVAIEKLKKSFYKHLSETKLREVDKKKIIAQFEQDMKAGKYRYHFRDNRRVDELQYFAKVHRRHVMGELNFSEKYPMYRRKQVAQNRWGWRCVV